jgi:hypothetical protein
LLVVIDEAPRLLASQPDFADLVSAVWENRLRDQQAMLVLTGSAVSVMEEMLGAQGGLHRRAALELRLDPFPAREARAFLPGIPAADFLTAYAVCGGYPLHLEQWDQAADVETNLRRLAYASAGLLVRDALDIIGEDLDWRGGYERVLAAIGFGARRRSRIAGRAQQRIDYTLERLRRVGYVRRTVPVGSVTADPLYEIADTYLAFWFGVLRDDVDFIEGGQGAAVRQRTPARSPRGRPEPCCVRAGQHPGEVKDGNAGGWQGRVWSSISVTVIVGGTAGCVGSGPNLNLPGNGSLSGTAAAS